jgi:hypothetical protein
VTPKFNFPVSFLFLKQELIFNSQIHDEIYNLLTNVAGTETIRITTRRGAATAEAIIPILIYNLPLII